MANYIFAPSPNFGTTEHPFVTWREGFTSEEIDQIIKLGESFPTTTALVEGKESLEKSSIRESQVSWIPQNEDTLWIYDRLSWIARHLNGEFYKFDLHGFGENFQFSVYDETYNGHYTWHRDSGFTSQGTPPRKLTLVLQLTDPSEYEGGSLEVFTKPDPEEVDKEKGLVTVFPSFTLHRVTPVTKGTRKTLVAWICGPAFK